MCSILHKEKKCSIVHNRFRSSPIRSVLPNLPKCLTQPSKAARLFEQFSLSPAGDQAFSRIGKISVEAVFSVSCRMDIVKETTPGGVPTIAEELPVPARDNEPAQAIEPAASQLQVKEKEQLQVKDEKEQGKIREARVEDYTQIAAVSRRNGLGFKSEEQWRHLWLESPVFRRVKDWPLGWVAVTADDQVVGYMGNVIISFSFQGEELICGCPFGMAVDPPYRRLAGFMGRRFMSQKNAQIEILTSANSNSSPLAEMLRSIRVPVGDWDHSVYWITNNRGFAACALAMKKLPRALAYPAAVAMSVKSKFTGAPFRAASGRVPLTEYCTFDESFERFWQDLKTAYPQRLLADRSLEGLLWHFKFALQQNRVWILTTGSGSRISAYAIFYRHDNPAIGLKRMRLIDFQTLDGNVEVLAPMLAWAHERCKREGIDMLEAYGFRPEKEAVIESLRPLRRRLPAWFYFYYTRNKALAPVLADPNIWDPCHFDGDSSL